MKRPTSTITNFRDYAIKNKRSKARVRRDASGDGTSHQEQTATGDPATVEGGPGIVHWGLMGALWGSLWALVLSSLYVVLIEYGPIVFMLYWNVILACAASAAVVVGVLAMSVFALMAWASKRARF